MKSSYSRKAWTKVNESKILECIEGMYLQKGYRVKNYHKDDTRHEKGIDLLCRKKEEQIAFATKKKPGKGDIRQLRMFIKNTESMKSVYVYIYPPTRPFEEALKKIGTKVEIWDSLRLHKELVANESVPYICLYFSGHPIVKSLTQAYRIIYDKRETKYTPHQLTSQEASVLWLVKDNVVKMRIALLQIHRRWGKQLMTITKKQPEDYDRILDDIFSDLDIANDLAGEKLVSSFKRLSEEYPSLLGLYWTLASHRSGWDALTFALKSLAESKVENYIIFNQVLPNLVYHRFSGVMRGFYSSVNYVLENFHEASKDLEDGVDWVFDEIKGNKDTQSS